MEDQVTGGTNARIWLTVGVLLAIDAVPLANAQIVVRECRLVQFLQQLGDCSECPPGGIGFENCTQMEITLDQHCSGACLSPYVCGPAAEELMPYDWLYICDNHCDDPLFPECHTPLDPIRVLRDVLPTSCGCGPV